mmetsp:Transcript_74533/g.207088  ORF Transcript_74533/g.207088 Transcript_74533/m.207088 type:complete len:257 (+) Transcript_74533:141-911(+)
MPAAARMAFASVPPPSSATRAVSACCRTIFARCTASSTSSGCACERPARKAKKTASFTMFASSAPLKPGVASAARASAREFFKPLAAEARMICSFKISSRSAWSGSSMYMWRSNRPGRRSAASIASDLFVAARTTRPSPLPWKPSSSVRSWFSVCTYSSFAPKPFRDRLPTASSSSRKSTAGAAFRACRKRSLTRAAPRPTKTSTNSEADAVTKAHRASPATARARSVLPVPLGPTRRAPRGSRAPARWYFSGLFK